MSASLSTASIPVFEICLNALSKVLDKAQAFVASGKISEADLLHKRLAPDMFDLTRQIQIVSDHARRGAARLAGVEPLSIADTETTIAQLKDRLAKTVAYVKSVDHAKIDAGADREVVLPLGGGKTGQMTGADYLNHFLLPNFYFHLTTAYDIIRNSGVEIGKRDFLGAIPIKMAA
jgi:uncharacterized protein